MKTLFEIGELHIDDDALQVIRTNGASIHKLLGQHQAGNWGNGIDGADVLENAHTLALGDGWLTSIHTIGGKPVVITTTLTPASTPNLTEIELHE